MLKNIYWMWAESLSLRWWFLVAGTSLWWGIWFTCCGLLGRWGKGIFMNHRNSQMITFLLYYRVTFFDLYRSQSCVRNRNIVFQFKSHFSPDGSCSIGLYHPWLATSSNRCCCTSLCFPAPLSHHPWVSKVKIQQHKYICSIIPKLEDWRKQKCPLHQPVFFYRWYWREYSNVHPQVVGCSGEGVRVTVDSSHSEKFSLLKFSARTQALKEHGHKHCQRLPNWTLPKVAKLNGGRAPSSPLSTSSSPTISLPQRQGSFTLLSLISRLIYQEKKLKKIRLETFTLQPWPCLDHDRPLAQLVGCRLLLLWTLTAFR